MRDNDAIKGLKAGRDLDALIDTLALRQSGIDPPAYSTDLIAAAPVLNKLDLFYGERWAVVRDGNGWSIYQNPAEIGFYPPMVEAATLPLAVCLATLTYLRYGDRYHPYLVTHGGHP